VPDPVTGRDAIPVSYRSETRFAGAARRGPTLSQLVRLEASGTGKTNQYYDRETGALLSAHTTADMLLQVWINGRLQRLHQQADWKAESAARR
jgi:hypothetical protein